MTTGGASVGKHDNVIKDLTADTLDFWKIAMRPGKPLLWGRVGKTPLMGLPGNPVSTAVCALVFLWPAICKLSGGKIHDFTFSAPLTKALRENDQRQDYIRSKIVKNENEKTAIHPAPHQDSSMMTTLVYSNAFIVRPPFDPPKRAGDLVDVLPMPSFF